MKKLLLIFVFAVMLPQVAVASGDAGTESPFSFGAGAKELALGGAGLTICDPATAPFWNASRLATAEYYSLGSFYTRLYDTDVTYQYAGLAVPTLDYGCFAVGAFRLAVDGIEKRDDSNLKLGETSEQRLGFYLAYGRSIASYDLGMALNFESHSLDSYSATSSPGLSLSGSRQFVTGLRGLPLLSLAANGRNLVSPRMKLAYANADYPSSADIGLDITTIPISRWNHSLTICSRLVKTDGRDAQISAGLEYAIHQILFIRGGLRKDKPSYGGGLHYKLLRFDYAYVWRDLGPIHLFSLTSSFGSSLSEKKARRTAKHEELFNNMMRERLDDRTRQMITTLEKDGADALAAGNLSDASDAFDRALFLARNSCFDTVYISDKAIEARLMLVEATKKNQFREYVNTAQEKLRNRDYVAARYYAQLASSLISDSKEARNLLKEIDGHLKKTAAREEMVTSRMSNADSLVVIGELDQALVTLKAASQFAPDDDRVRKALRKVQFECYREAADLAFSANDLKKAGALIDSALLIVPINQYCLNLRSRIRAAAKLPAVAEKEAASVSMQPASPVIIREVDNMYKTAKRYFEQGNLAEAISQWEHVELLAPGYLAVRKYLVDAYKFAGIEYYGQNRLQDAIELWKKARRLEPENSEIAKYIERGEYELAKQRELSYGSDK